MRELTPRLRQWLAEGTVFSLATVVKVSGSAPREPGAAMAVSAAGEVVGSVSGGCVEGAVFEAATEVLETGEPRRETYGFGDETALSVGLTCGGIIEILIQRVDPASSVTRVLDSIGEEEPVAVATVIDGPAPPGARRCVWQDRADGTLGDERLDAAVTEDARGLLTHGMTGIKRYGAHGERCGEDIAVFVQSFAPAPGMLVFGANDFAVALSRVGSDLGYRVTVCDARPVFARAGRFPRAHEVVCAWPHDYLARTEVDERTVICVLTHDPKFEELLLMAALRTPAAYIGVMGSRRTHIDRTGRLRERGATGAQLARLSSPIGLDLGARTPEETAVSIAAEIIQRRQGGTGLPLGHRSGPIHRRTLPQTAVPVGNRDRDR
ncbi:XdhC/CoxI family protein [Streptomyces sp. NEAU-YJ-81]|uniref:XdhC family protein n=1 Tax=Streptomyces sp. NEAU-YJ-81 TaxID=2820288 RepID=UPI001ABCD4CB|nr:XdhC/CoxI family protein [Streptomyces sp. NEAU-YJ-81]MBO3678946.1 XdhC family protein [Streptomyces sp. NEAU-YJ-81]